MAFPTRRLSVTKVILLNIDPVRVLFPSSYRSGSFGMGNVLHKQLGFTNQRFLSRTVDGWIISGVPDKITEKYIEDLKTYRAKSEMGYQLDYAKMQVNIYCYLEGNIHKYKVTLFNTVTHKHVTKTFRASYKRAEKDIRFATKRWSGIMDALGLTAIKIKNNQLEDKDDEKINKTKTIKKKKKGRVKNIDR